MDDDYRWFEFVDQPPERRIPIEQRFPTDWPWLSGAYAWSEGVGVIRSLGSEIDPTGESLERASQWLERIRQSPRNNALCPRIFVSHRQPDDKEALRIAWLAKQEGWGYWLDLVDLNASSQLAALQNWLGAPPNALQKSIFTAALIEMGLLNCTHVIAVMTGNTKGSQWVPYEYGRVKEATPLAMNAASWWDSTTLKFNQLPEYLFLAPILENELQIRGWLKGQLFALKSSNRYLRCPGTAGSWHLKTPPDELPTK